jgi:hypothetical protein
MDRQKLAQKILEECVLKTLYREEKRIFKLLISDHLAILANFQKSVFYP